MGDELCGILNLGILRNAGGLIASLDWASAEEAWLADVRMTLAERPGVFESQSVQVYVPLQFARGADVLHPLVRIKFLGFAHGAL
jgi:hypothetical protein